MREENLPPWAVGLNYFLYTISLHLPISSQDCIIISISILLLKCLWCDVWPVELVRLPCGIHRHRDMVRESPCFQISCPFIPCDDQAKFHVSVIVSTMINKLHGQPQSYDKKCVSDYRSHKWIPEADWGVQVTIQAWKDVGSRNLWRSARSRLCSRQGRRQDHFEKECQGQRADGVWRTRDAATAEAPTHCALPRLVRVKSGFPMANCVLHLAMLTALARTSTTSSPNSLPAASCSTGSANTASLPKKMPHKLSNRCLKPSATYTGTT